MDASLKQLDASMTSLDLNADRINVEEFSDIQNSIIDWADDTWYPGKESVLSLEEEEETQTVLKMTTVTVTAILSPLFVFCRSHIPFLW